MFKEKQRKVMNSIVERPILFSTPMVQGILSNAKTMTRRSSGLEQINAAPESFEFMGLTTNDGNIIANFFLHRVAGYRLKCPYGKPGDRLWVCETFAIESDFNRSVQDEKRYPYFLDRDGVKRIVHFKANFPTCKLKWKPSIHMPRTASRLLLEIKEVGVERLQDITEEDAIAEGMVEIKDGNYKYYSASVHYSKDELKEFCPLGPSAVSSFFTLWKSLKGSESLLQNPWVWVIKFKVLEVKK